MGRVSPTINRSSIDITLQRWTETRHIAMATLVPHYMGINKDNSSGLSSNCAWNYWMLWTNVNSPKAHGELSSKIPDSDVEIYRLHVFFLGHPQMAPIKGGNQWRPPSRTLMATLTGCYTLSQEIPRSIPGEGNLAFILSPISHTDILKTKREITSALLWQQQWL